MPEFASFFNSEDGSRIYNAQVMRDFIDSFFNSGIFQNGFAPAASSGMTITIGSGYTAIKGVVQYFPNNEAITIDVADALYSRIDTIVVELSEEERDVTIKYIKGDYVISNPTPKPPVRTDDIYQLVLAQISVPAGTIEITSQLITDTRADETICGYLTSKITNVDFTQLTAQFNAYFEETKAKDLADFNTWVESGYTDLDATTYDNLSDDVSQCANDANTIAGDASTLKSAMDTLETNVDNTEISLSNIQLVETYEPYWPDPTEFVFSGSTPPVAIGLLLQLDRTGSILPSSPIKLIWLIRDSVTSTSATYIGYGNAGFASGADGFAIPIHIKAVAEKTQRYGADAYVVDLSTTSGFGILSAIYRYVNLGDTSQNASLAYRQHCPMTISRLYRVDE